MANTEKTEKKEEKNPEGDELKFKGRFVEACGRRKTAVARVRLYKKGTGLFAVNGEKISRYFLPDQITLLKQPLKMTEHLRDLNISVITNGGGKKNQAEAVRHGLSRALVMLEDNIKPVLKAKDLLTRDPRRKERKKPGLKKARRAPQWSKR